MLNRDYEDYAMLVVESIVKISAVKQLIASKIKVFVYVICVCTVYMYNVCINTNIIYIENIFMYIFI